MKSVYLYKIWADYDDYTRYNFICHSHENLTDEQLEEKLSEWYNLLLELSKENEELRINIRFKLSKILYDRFINLKYSQISEEIQNAFDRTIMATHLKIAKNYAASDKRQYLKYINKQNLEPDELKSCINSYNERNNRFKIKQKFVREISNDLTRSLLNEKTVAFFDNLGYNDIQELLKKNEEYQNLLKGHDGLYFCDIRSYQHDLGVYLGGESTTPNLLGQLYIKEK